jgi:hypothetical protein
MRLSIVKLAKSLLPFVVSLLILGCWEGEKPTPLKRVESSAAGPNDKKSPPAPSDTGKRGEKEKPK